MTHDCSLMKRGPAVLVSPIEIGVCFQKRLEQFDVIVLGSQEKRFRQRRPPIVLPATCKQKTGNLDVISADREREDWGVLLPQIRVERCPERGQPFDDRKSATLDGKLKIKGKVRLARWRHLGLNQRLRHGKVPMIKSDKQSVLAAVIRTQWGQAVRHQLPADGGLPRLGGVMQGIRAGSIETAGISAAGDDRRDDLGETMERCLVQRTPHLWCALREPGRPWTARRSVAPSARRP